MEISTIKIAGANVDVIFTGEKYFFYNAFFGLVAMATRKGYGNDEDLNTFTLTVGNSHCLGSHFSNCTVYAAAKRFIKKSECKYIERVTSFIEEEKDLARGYVSVDYIER